VRHLLGSLFLALLFLAAPARGAAQSQEGSWKPELIALGDEQHRQLRPLEALAHFREVLEADPGEPEALWRAAREAVSLGMLAMSSEDARRWYGTAEGYARSAVELEPERVEGHHWLAVALGRRALKEGPRIRVRLAEEVRDQGLRILELDPNHPGGHHILGQWHAEVLRLSGISRMVARTLLGGGTFNRASWDEAERHLLTAVERAPEGLIHHLELARVLLDRGEEERGRAALREVLDRPAAAPVDPLLKQQAMDLLRSLNG